ncbi:MAG: hypothetical protein JSR00_00580 [Bacteroidetes bacterium]|nr:hypothetical protein [Bacteroidota bacterium]
MKNKLLFILFAVFTFIMASCTTSYKNSQTVDDVYYSPLKNIPDEEVVNQDEVTRDRQIRMSVVDPRWRTLDMYYDYNYNPYNYYGYGYGYYYNPYYYSYPVYYYPGLSYIKSVNSTPRTTNLSTYTPAVKSKPQSPKNRNNYGSYNNSNSNSTRRVITNSTGNDNRTYSPSSNVNSGSRGSSTPVTRPTRP